MSCKAVELDKNIEIRRKIGIIDHKYFPVSHDIPGERIDNSENFQTITDFIASTEIIISSSYHVVFWGTLMNKKVICANAFSTKFDYFKHKPVFYSGDIEHNISQTKIFPNALQEARNLNNDFFERVRETVQTVISNPNKQYQYVYDMTFPALVRNNLGAIAEVQCYHNDIALLRKKRSIYWNYYRYKLLSMFTFGKTRKHYKNKRETFHDKIRKIRRLYRAK